MRRALSLAERGRCAGRDGVHSEAARSRLAKWKSQPAFARLGQWEHRLVDAGLTETALLDLLDEDETALAARIEAPAWMIALERAFARRPLAAALGDRIAAIAQPTTRAELRLAAPLVEAPFLELRTVLASAGGRLPCDPDWLEGALFDQLVARLETPLLRSLSLAVNVARVRGELSGSSPEERFEEFVSKRVAAGMGAFFADSPLLARHVLSIAESWASSSALLVRDLAADLPSLVGFLGGADAGRLVELQGGAGDVHRGGRSVMILRFEDGRRAVYKPHSLAVDRHFGALIAEIDGAAAAHDLLDMLAVEVLDRGDHGYAEFLPTEPCGSVEEMARFFRRQGQNLALVFALEGIDIHSENVVAHGEYPVVVDLEALFHPRIHHISSSDPASRAYRESVLRILFLPARAESRQGEVGFDVSALGNRSGQMSPRPVPWMVELGTDTMHVERQVIALDGNPQRPTIAGADVDVMAYLEPVCQGFRSMSRYLVSRRSELLAPGGAIAAFANDEVRVIVRNTSTYDLMLRASYHPPLLRDGLERDRLFDHLYQDVAFQPALGRLVEHERADLWAGDIPVFTVGAASVDIMDSRGRVIPEVITTSGFEGATTRLRGLDDDAVERELWVIRGSFATIPLGKGEEHWKSSALEPTAREVSVDELVARARTVGDRLVTLAHRDDGRANWLGMAFFGVVEWKLTALDVGLYDGCLGIAMFLGYLARVTGQRTYAELALDAFGGAEALMSERARFGDEEQAGISGGPASFVYAASHLAHALDRPDLLLRAEAALGPLTTVVCRPDAGRDVIGGNAGCLYGLLALASMSRNPRPLELVRLAAERLASVATAQAEGVAWEPDIDAAGPLTGFSHGASGIGLALARAGAVLGGDAARSYADLAVGAVRYERTASSGDNWYDYRTFGVVGPIRRRAMCTWCHGAPGVGFARAGLLGLDVSDHDAIAHELAVAAATTERTGFGLNHSLCHGDLGNVEVLALAARMLGDDALDQAYRRRLAQIADSIDRMGWSCGVPLGVENPGLLTGIAGVGYGWLRAALPDEIPSVLLLEAPRRDPPK